MLTGNQIDRFQDDGYIVLESFFSGEKLARQKAVLEELTERGCSMKETSHFAYELDAKGDVIPGVLHKVQAVCVVERRVLEIAADQDLLDVVEPLVGPDIDVLGTKFFPKLPKIGTSTQFHQDSYYFGTVTDRIVSCGIYYEAADRENGCLRVVPGSHRERVIVEHHPAPHLHGHWIEVDESKAVDVVCPAGTVVLFTANLMHGAYDNHSERTRYSTAWHYLPGDLNPEHMGRDEYEDRFVVRGR